MTAPTATRPCLAERIANASNSNDLSVRLESRGDADYLIAAGAAPAQIGRSVYSLMAEWDACAKPRPITEEDIARIAEQLPRIRVVKQGKRGTPKTVEALDLAGARAQVDEWMGAERRRIVSRLRSLPKLLDPHAGLLPWVKAQGYGNARDKLLDVLGWWADRCCPNCHGTGEADGRTCKHCRATGLRDVPHGREGQSISEHIAHHVDRARSGSIAALKRTESLKKIAAAVV